MKETPPFTTLLIGGPSQGEKPGPVRPIDPEQGDKRTSSAKHPHLEMIASFLVSDSPSATKIRRGILKLMVLGGTAMLSEGSEQSSKATANKAKPASNSSKPGSASRKATKKPSSRPK